MDTSKDQPPVNLSDPSNQSWPMNCLLQSSVTDHHCKFESLIFMENLDETWAGTFSVVGIPLLWSDLSCPCSELWLLFGWSRSSTKALPVPVFPLGLVLFYHFLDLRTWLEEEKVTKRHEIDPDELFVFRSEWDRKPGRPLSRARAFSDIGSRRSHGKRIQGSPGEGAVRQRSQEATSVVQVRAMQLGPQ